MIVIGRVSGKAVGLQMEERLEIFGDSSEK